MTIRAGGPVEGAVTVAAIPGGQGRSVAIVSSVRRPAHDTSEVATFEQPLLVAHSVADQLAAGTPPDRASA